MYLACICMYWFVYYKLDTDKYKPLQMFGLNTAQYRRNPASIHREWIGMYLSVMVCIVGIGMYCSVLVCIFDTTSINELDTRRKMQLVRMHTIHSNTYPINQYTPILRIQTHTCTYTSIHTNTNTNKYMQYRRIHAIQANRNLIHINT